MKLSSIGWAWDGNAWVALFMSDDRQVWHSPETQLLALVAEGAEDLETSLFGSAHGMPPWGTVPDARQVERGPRMLEHALPFTGEILSQMIMSPITS